MIINTLHIPMIFLLVFFIVECKSNYKIYIFVKKKHTFIHSFIHTLKFTHYEKHTINPKQSGKSYKN